MALLGLVVALLGFVGGSLGFVGGSLGVVVALLGCEQPVARQATFFNSRSNPSDMKVLLGIGGTDGSLVALERTVERAAETGDDLTVVILESEGTELTRDELEDRVESAVSETALSVDIRHVEGEPGSQLVDIAESEAFDEIVLGGSTTSPMGKININKTAEFVLLNSHVTVTLVR